MKKSVVFLVTAALILSLSSCALSVTVGAPEAPEPDYGIGLSNLTVIKDEPAGMDGKISPVGNGSPAPSDEGDASNQPDISDPSEGTDAPPTLPEGTDAPPILPEGTDAPPILPEGTDAPSGNEPTEEPPTEDAPTLGEETDPPTPPASPAMTPEEMRAVAESMIGSQVSSLIAAIGDPVNFEHVPSCLVEGEDGLFFYEGFTVYTEKVGSSEVITYVE